MTRFVPASAAETLSHALWCLANPAPKDGDTRYLFPFVDSLDGSRWLEVLTDYNIHVHVDADFMPIAAILQPWIDAGHLPVDTNIQLALLVDANRGGTLVVYDAFPQLFKDMSLTHEQMVQNGLLPGGMVP